MSETDKVIIRKIENPATAKSELPELLHTIEFRYNSPVNKKEYTGTFTYRKLTLGDYSKITAMRVRINGGLSDDLVDQPTWNVSNAIAHCSYWFTEPGNCPEWAKDLTKLYDQEIAISLFEEGMRYENSFRKAVG